MGKDIGKAVRASGGKENAVADWWRHLGYESQVFKTARARQGPIYVTIGADLWECIDVASMLEEEDAPFEQMDVDLPWIPDEFYAFEYAQVCTPAGAYQHKRKIEAHHWPMRQLNLTFRVTLWMYRGRDYRVMEWRGNQGDRRKWVEWEHHITL